jgi:hypothetical protein
MFIVLIDINKNRKRGRNMFNQYPIGKFTVKENIQKEDIQGWIHDIGDAPKQLADAVEGLTKEQLATPYREGGWKLSQVVHHLADSHMNAYTLQLFSALHKRLHKVLNSLDEIDLKKTIHHPENGEVTIEQLIATYAWHGKHHIAHITTLRTQKGW